MRSRTSVLCSFLLLFSFAVQQSTSQNNGGVILFEGARLITGDGSAPIENSAFLIENNRISKVGKKGQLQAPAGATRVDLTGKTVMPGIVDAHSHPGYTNIKTNRTEKETYTRENLVDHMKRHRLLRRCSDHESRCRSRRYSIPGSGESDARGGAVIHVRAGYRAAADGAGCGISKRCGLRRDNRSGGAKSCSGTCGEEGRHRQVLGG